VSLTRNIGAAARDVGIRESSTAFVAFLDDDTWPEPGGLRAAARVLATHREVAIVTGHVLVGPEAADDPTSVVMAKSPIPTPAPLPGRAVIGFLAGASVVRRDAFVSVGGFGRNARIGGEEQLIAYSLLEAGWKILYLPELVVHHYPSPNRDRAARARVEARSRLRVVWMRRPLTTAINVTLSGYMRSAERRLLLRDLTVLIPAIIQRDRLSDATEQLLRLVESSATRE
jgi:GT2 family glycosyltransferase